MPVVPAYEMEPAVILVSRVLFLLLLLLQIFIQAVIMFSMKFFFFFTDEQSDLNCFITETLDHNIYTFPAAEENLFN